MQRLSDVHQTSAIGDGDNSECLPREKGRMKGVKENGSIHTNVSKGPKTYSSTLSTHIHGSCGKILVNADSCRALEDKNYDMGAERTADIGGLGCLPL